MAQFIGTLISLTSKSDIRYTGKLEAIDQQESTISLSGVRSLGTEGRTGDPSKEIPPNDSVYDFIIFRASDVKDLKIEQNASAQQKPAPMPADPAIMSSQRPAQTQQQQTQQQQTQQPQPQQPQPQQPQTHQQHPQHFQGGPLGPGYPGGPTSPWGPPPASMYGGPYGYNMPPPPGMTGPPGMIPNGVGMQAGFGGPFRQPPPGQPWGQPPMPGQYPGVQQAQPQGTVPPSSGASKPGQPQQRSQSVHTKDIPVATTTDTLPESAAPKAKEQPTAAISSANAQQAPRQQREKSPAPSAQQSSKTAGAPISRPAQAAPKASGISPFPVVVSPFPSGMVDSMLQSPSQLDRSVQARSPSAAQSSQNAKLPAQAKPSAAKVDVSQDSVPQPKPSSFASAVSNAAAAMAKPQAAAVTTVQSQKQQSSNPSTSVDAVARGAGAMRIDASTEGRQKAGQIGSSSRDAGRGGRVPFNSSRPQRGGMYNGVGAHGAPRPNGSEQPTRRPSAPLPAGDFDFAGMNEKFDKPSASVSSPIVEQAESEKVVIPPVSPDNAFYNKTASFFDTISSDLNAGSGEGRPDRQQERNRNMATFGESGANVGGGYRGRGRGFRGGNDSRGRGGDGFRGGRGGSSYRGRGRGESNVGR